MDLLPAPMPEGSSVARFAVRSRASPKPCGASSTGRGPPSDDTHAQALAASLVEEMAAAWQQGHCLAAEEFLTRHPELAAHPEAAVQLIYEEICLRREAGQEVATTEVLRRFPQWQAELELLFDCHHFLQPYLAAPTFPHVGEMLGEFRLLAELGRGTRGRVFLAAQPSLADRLLVLKLTPGEGHEHLALARLQHAHIVPLYLVQHFPAQNLQALCMPYLGGTTLARLLEVLQGQRLEQRTGQHLLEALDQVPVPLAPPAQGPARKFLAQASYVKAICWIGACLADALHYAHERGLVHLDLKPSNVLLAADGQPMLLDFHLAREPLQPDSPVPEWLGGTPGYMSPEQQAALRAVAEGRPIPAVVDGRSDVFSLGLLLYEILGGIFSLTSGSAPARLERRNADVSPGLADIIHKCLAHDPGARYPDAAALAADLRRHLTDQPLHGVVNRNLRERWRKWQRRQPHLLPLTAMLLAALLVVLSAALVVETNVRAHNNQRLHAAETAAQIALVDGANQLKNHQYAEAVRILTRGLAHARSLSARQDLTGALDKRLRLAQRAQAVEYLYLLAQRLRFVYGVDSFSPDKLRALQTQGRTIWQTRRHLLDPQGGELEPEIEQRLRTDLFDLAILWTNLNLRLAPVYQVLEARQEALKVLAEAEALFGPRQILYRERQLHAEALGLTEMAQVAQRRAAELVPRTAWEHHTLGRFHLQAGRLEQAATGFAQALELQPADFWSHFYQGICAYRLQQPNQAVMAFQVCVALAPQSAECFYNRALAHAALGQTDSARRDYSRALQLNPILAAAALNRAILHYQAKRYSEALADLQQALDAGADAATVQFNRDLIHRDQAAQRDQ